jgi:hypothetical protein
METESEAEVQKKYKKKCNQQVLAPKMVNNGEGNWFI